MFGQLISICGYYGVDVDFQNGIVDCFSIMGLVVVLGVVVVNIGNVVDVMFGLSMVMIFLVVNGIFYVNFVLQVY